MKIIQRMVLRDFLGPFIFAVVVLTAVLLLDKIFLLVDLLVKKGIPFLAVIELMVYCTPFVLEFAVPMGILIASVMLFGRLSQDNELTAIRSAGINPFQLLVPLIVFTSVLTILMILFNGYVLPEANHRARNLISDIARKKPAVRIYEGVFLDDFPGYMLYIGSIDDRTGKISDVTIWEKKNPDDIPTLIKSKTGKISTSPDEKYFIIELESGEISELVDREKYRHLSFDNYVINLPIDVEFYRRERKYRSDQELLLNDLYTKTKSLKQEIKGLKREIKSLNQISDINLRKYRLDDTHAKLRSKKSEYNQLATELEKKYALAIACIVFLFWGAGLGGYIKRSGLGVGFIVGLVFFAVYYILILAGEEFADAGRTTPFIGMWFSNLILLPLAIEFTATTFFEFSFAKKISQYLLSFTRPRINTNGLN
ncbi:MAG: LptF/LptG family permease [candidate division WOR-3 bacterium]|nr:LptF/LptG family permease [candidate division WOR-3 bacterium]